MKIPTSNSISVCEDCGNVLRKCDKCEDLFCDDCRPPGFIAWENEEGDRMYYCPDCHPDMDRVCPECGRVYPDANLKSAGTPSRNAPCPCGSGKKYKKCCGRPEPKKKSK